MIYCKKCVLPETFPGIEFDKEGVCNYCRNTQQPDKAKKEEYLERFERIADEVRGKQRFDAVIAYSGGKDSTYTLMKLTEKFRLSVLALTFDNGFLSNKSLGNIKKMTDRAGAVSWIIRPPFPLISDIFRAAAGGGIFSPKTLDRASSICTACIGMVKSQVTGAAIRYGIPLAAYGWSPGQAPITSSIMKTGPGIQSFSNRSIRDPLVSKCGPRTAGLFLSEEEMSASPERWPLNVHLLAFMDYSEDDILREITGAGWEKPDDTDPNSTNCTLNALANHLHRREFDFHPYAWENAGIVRAGAMSREEGLDKTTSEDNPELVRRAAGMLGINLQTSQKS